MKGSNLETILTSLKNVKIKKSEKKVFGVCAGIASALGVDKMVVRAITLGAGIIFPAYMPWIYMGAALLLPCEEKEAEE